MGEVVGGILLIVIFGSFIGLMVFAVLPRKPQPNNGELDYKNHLAMAIWIDHQLRDDMVSCTISESDKKLAHKLLNEFYKEI